MEKRKKEEKRKRKKGSANGAGFDSGEAITNRAVPSDTGYNHVPDGHAFYNNHLPVST